MLHAIHDRRIWVFGDTITPGDRVKIIHKSHKCQGLDDWENVVAGGQGRALDMLTELGQALPSPIGEYQWPAPFPNGSAVFTLMRVDEAVLCYLHRDGAGWVDVRSTDGERIAITVRDTSDLALGRTGALSGNTATSCKPAQNWNKMWTCVLMVAVTCHSLRKGIVLNDVQFS